MIVVYLLNRKHFQGYKGMQLAIYVIYLVLLMHSSLTKDDQIGDKKKETLTKR